MAREYEIYKITSPSGRSYIGLTSMGLRERWRKHQLRAETGINHPFYCAIRKYGPENFTVELVCTALGKHAAQQAEMREIAKRAKDNLYNVSPGGEADGEAGSKVFWDRMRSDPAARARYTKKLSRVKKENDWTDYEATQEKAQEWRRENPKEAHRLSRRASRVAARAQNRGIATIDNRPLKERLMWKHKRGEKARENALALWASRDEDARKEVGAKIRVAQKAVWDKKTDPEERSKLTEKARASIDRSKQGPAASKGIKKFWEDLKKDPERYAEYMGRRTASLMKTIERKAEK